MPKKSLASLDIYKFLQETSFLQGATLRDVKSRKNEFFFLFYKGSERWLKAVPGQYICIQNERPRENINYPFTELLKKELLNKKAAINMHGADRIVELDFTESLLSIELFSKGNIILSKHGRIVRSLFSRDYSSRKVAEGEPMSYPPAVSDIFSMDKQVFYDTLKRSDKENLVKSLALDFSLGGVYAEELCFRAHIDKAAKITEIDTESADKLYLELRKIIERPSKPNIFDGAYLSVIDLEHINADKRYFKDINSAIIEFFSEEQPVSRKKVDSHKNFSVRIQELKDSIEKVNSSYEELEQLFDLARNSGIKLEDRKKALEERGWRLEGATISSAELPGLILDIRKGLRANIDHYYAEMKKLSRGLKVRPENRQGPKKLRYLERDAWYSKFRWGLTSSGDLVVIGRDNAQNIKLIEKYMEKDDIVLHADVFGSPFGLIKSNGKSASMGDIDEAAHMVASYSSAWKNGAGNIDVYYVKPYQVTRSPPSGESLKKGAFYISGTREYVKNVELYLYIGIDISSESYSLTVSSFKPKKDYFLVTPGNKTREDVLKRMIKIISDTKGVLLERDRIDRLLPQGKCSIKDTDMRKA